MMMPLVIEKFLLTSSNNKGPRWTFETPTLIRIRLIVDRVDMCWPYMPRTIALSLQKKSEFSFIAWEKGSVYC